MAETNVHDVNMDASDSQDNTSQEDQALEASVAQETETSTTGNGTTPFSNKTRNVYNGYISRGQEFLKSLVQNNTLPTDPPEYDQAFNKTIEASPVALLQFIVHYMAKGACKYATAEGIRNAFEDHFQRLGCQGDFWREDGKGGYEGNPVYDSEFSQYMRMLKNKDTQDGTRSRSLAITYDDMALLMTHLQHSETREEHGKDLCVMFEAFAATAFTIWTRTGELVKLKGADIMWDQESDAGRSFFIITLPFRKSNQSPGIKGNTYHIYPTPLEPHTCCYTKLLAWKALLEQKTQALRPSDLIFPNISSKGVLKPMETLSHTQIQSFLDIFTAHITRTRRGGKFTRHCFRRGGAQHRFMYAQEKWPLKAIKWWGGWSEGEKPSTIIRYLLDEFAHYETGYSDMLSPDRDDSRHSLFMNQGSATDPVVTSKNFTTELSALKDVLLEAIGRKFELIYDEIARQGQQVNEIASIIFAEQNAKEMQRRSQEHPSTPMIGQAVQEVPRHPTPTRGVAHPTPAPSNPSIPYQRPVASIPANERPGVPKIPDAKDWYDCVRQWRYGDPSRNLHCPLMNWNAKMRKTDPQRYSQRKLIGEEFKRLGYDEARMVAKYGPSLGTIKGLLQAIRYNNKAREARENEIRDREEAQNQEQGSVLAAADPGTAPLSPIATPGTIVPEQDEEEEDETLTHEHHSIRKGHTVVEENEMSQEQAQEQVQEQAQAQEREREQEQEQAMLKEDEDDREGRITERQKLNMPLRERREFSPEVSSQIPGESTRHPKRVKTS
ncbi:hypothetical protein BGZ94_010256 [Podila epigama]|nr:hypothetical protein BGZ94_010256 [Podila epigama]